MPSINDFEKELEKLATKFVPSEETYSVKIEGEENFNKFLLKLEEHGQNFVTRNSYMNRREKTAKARLLWQNEKAPYTIDNVIKKTCVLGPSNSTKKKDEIENGHPRGKSKRFRKQPTKKVDCPAVMNIIVTTSFPEYCIPENAKNIRKIKATKLKALSLALEENYYVLKEKKFDIILSKPSTHSHPVSSSFLNQTLNDELKQKINQYVSEGITDIETIQKLLEVYVKTSISSDIPTSSRSFYPIRKTIYNHVKKFTNQSLSSKVDQVALEAEIETWEITIEDNTVLLPEDILEPAENSSEQILSMALQKLKQQIEDIYDKSFLIPSSASASALHQLSKKLSDIQVDIDNLISVQSESNFMVLPRPTEKSVSDSPRKKRRKIENQSGTFQITEI